MFTRDHFSDGSFEALIRFENIFDEGELEEGQDNFDYDMPDDLFVGFKITDVKEMTLGGDREVEVMDARFSWNSSAKQKVKP